MSVGAHSQEDEIEVWPLVGEECTEGRGITRCGPLMVRVFRRDPKDVFARYRNLQQQGFISSSVVAILMIGRDASLVSPEKIDRTPWQPVGERFFGEDLEHGFRRRSARKRDGAAPAVLREGFGQFGETASRLMRQFRRAGVYQDLVI